MRRAFTLIEVNHAILIMAGGILAMVSLFSLGYRENGQSREDVSGAAMADAVMSPLVAACCATNVTWSKFKSLKNYPGDKGWAEYFNNKGIVNSDPNSKAESAFAGLMGDLGAGSLADVGATAFPTAARVKGMHYGLVIMHDQDSPVVRIAFRAAHRYNMLLSMPIYYTEARFQGLPDK